MVGSLAHYVIYTLDKMAAPNLRRAALLLCYSNIILVLEKY